jgi:hypothetical protein
VRSIGRSENDIGLSVLPIRTDLSADLGPIVGRTPVGLGSWPTFWKINPDQFGEGGPMTSMGNLLTVANSLGVTLGKASHGNNQAEGYAWKAGPDRFVNCRIGDKTRMGQVPSQDFLSPLADRFGKCLPSSGVGGSFLGFGESLVSGLWGTRWAALVVGASKRFATVHTNSGRHRRLRYSHSSWLGSMY